MKMNGKLEENIKDFYISNVNKIKDKFKDKYEEKTSKLFITYLSKKEQNIINDAELLIKDENFLKDFQTKIKSTKARWLREEKKKDYISIKNECILLEEYIKNKKSKEEILEKFETINKEDLFNNRLSEIKAWQKNKNSFLVDYFYFKDRTKNKIENIFFMDIVMFLFKEFNNKLNEIKNKKIEDVEKEYYMNIEENVVSNLREIAKISEDISNREKAFSKEEIEKFSNEETAIKVLNDNTSFEFTIDTENASQFLGVSIDKIDTEIRNSILKIVKVFNIESRKILQYALAQRVEIYKNIPIERPLSVIVKEGLNLENNTKTRKFAKNAILTLANVRYKIGEKGIGSFFDVVFKTEEGKHGPQEVVVFFLSGLLGKVLKDNNVLKFYADKFNAVSEEAQKYLLEFQDDRISRVLNKNNKLTRVMGIEDFKLIIRYKNKNTIKKRIEATLQELVDNKMCVKSFEKLGRGYYEIEYYEFSEIDKRTILGKDFKYGDIIENGSFKEIE